MKTQIPQSWQALAKANTPELLHAASLQVAMGHHYGWGGLWLVFQLAPGGHAPHNICSQPTLRSFRFLARHQSDGEIIGHLGIQLFQDTPDLTAVYHHTFVTGQSVLIYPKGLSCAGFLVPGAGPSRQVDAGPVGMVDALGSVACLDYMDQFQVIALRSLDPVEIPGFPKLASPGGVSFKGRNVF